MDQLAGSLGLVDPNCLASPTFHHFTPLSGRKVAGERQTRQCEQMYAPIEGSSAGWTAVQGARSDLVMPGAQHFVSDHLERRVGLAWRPFHAHLAGVVVDVHRHNLMPVLRDVP